MASSNVETFKQGDEAFKHRDDDGVVNAMAPGVRFRSPKPSTSTQGIS